MNEETEERASLYVLGLLEDKELADFEKELQSNAALRALIDELDATAAELAHIVPRHSPPPELRERVLAQAPSRSVIEVSARAGMDPVGTCRLPCFGRSLFDRRTKSPSPSDQPARSA